MVESPYLNERGNNQILIERLEENKNKMESNYWSYTMGPAKLAPVRLRKIKDHWIKANHNAKCPCGSGKKFKKCCINAINILNASF